MVGVECLAAGKERLLDMEGEIDLCVKRLLESSFDVDEKPKGMLCVQLE